MPDPKVEIATDIRAQLGEGAVWSAAQQALFWVDIPQGRIHRHDPASGGNHSWNCGRPIGCVAETASGKLVAALTDGFHELDPGTGDLTFLSGPKPGTRAFRFNDGSVDPVGRFLAGTMAQDPATDPDGTGKLYAFDGKAEAVEIMSGFRTQNGLAFSPDGRTAYVSDSHPSIRKIWAHDYDPETGIWSNPRVFLNTNGLPGRPDGGTTDADGCYWMAGVSGAQLLRITPRGRIDMTIPMPVSRPTRIAFGGRDFGQLYVTSIREPGEDLSGHVLTLRVPGITGFEAPVMQI